MAAAPSCSTDFLDLIVKSGLLDEAALAAIDDLPDDATQCAAALVNKGVLTKFQAKLLLNGRYKGFKLGPYFIREQIGAGGMGAVFLAEHETLKRRVALKVLTLPKEGNAQLSIERFLREARSAAALDHPNIVRLHDVGKNGDTHYLVMEYVEGQTLDQIITKGGPISSARAVEYIAQAAAGLQHAYEKGFVHRDIKPANLMLTKDGHVKILDMGLARPANEDDGKLTEVMDKGAIVGTADFISPEQAMNNPLDVRSDIYSLGATFFALVTGQPPFNGNTTQKLIQHQMKEAPSVMTLDRTFPEGLSCIVAKMLAKKPEGRYQTPADVIKALAEWLPQQASARVAAAISATDLAASGELTATLSEIASGTKRLGTSPRLNATVTKKRDWFWPGVGAAVLVVAGSVAAVLTLMNDKKTEWKSTVEQVENTSIPSGVPPKGEPKKAPPKAEPKPAPKKDTTTIVPTPPPPMGPTLVSLDLSKAAPVTITGRTVMNAANTQRYFKTEKTEGKGKFPTGWGTTAYGEHEAQFMLAEIDGPWACGVRNIAVSGGSGAMIATPRFESGTNKIRITFDCKTEGSTMLNVRFAQQLPVKKNAADIVNVPNGKEWRTITKDLDMKNGTGGQVEFHPRGLDTVWIRNVKVVQAGEPTDKPDRAAALYNLSFKSLKPGSQKFDAYPKTFTLREIEGVTLPQTIHINQHRPNISSEYSIADIDGVRALGIRMVEGDYGVQVHCTTADALTNLKPNDSVVIKLTYRFDGTGAGLAACQIGAVPYTKHNEVSLTPTGNTWRTIEIPFTRPEAGEKYEFIVNAGMKKDNAPRADGTIYIQSIDVTYADAKK